MLGVLQFNSMNAFSIKRIQDKQKVIINSLEASVWPAETVGLHHVCLDHNSLLLSSRILLSVFIERSLQRFPF